MGLKRVKEITSDNKVVLEEALVLTGILMQDAKSFIVGFTFFKHSYKPVGSANESWSSA